MSIVKSARLNTVIGKRDGNSLTFLNLVVESSIGEFKTTVKISFLCKGKGVAPKLIKSPFNLDRNIIKQMLDEAKVLLLPQKNNESTKENNKSTSVVYEFRGTFKENNESTKKKNKSTKTRKSSKPVVNTDEDSIMNA